MDSLLTTVFFIGKLHQSRIVKIFKLTSIVPMTGVTPGLLLWSPKSPRSYTYWDPRIHIIMSTGFLTNPSAVDHLKHFGVWLESFLSWDYHVNYICAIDNKVLGLIRWTFGPNNSEEVSTAYKTLVRPILEYAWLSGLESVFRDWSKSTSKVQGQYWEASHLSHLQIRKRISGDTWGPEMALAWVTKEVYLLSADAQDCFRTLWHRSSCTCFLIV